MATASPLFSSLFLLLLITTLPSYYCLLDPTSTTLAIVQATATLCALNAHNHTRRTILCTNFSQSPQSTPSFLITTPTTSFDAISGGPSFLCGLRSGDTSFFCWDGIRQRMKRVYRGPAALSQISVGSWHIAAIDGDRRNIRWWSYGCNRHAFRCHHFPKSVSGEYRSLTSGNHFTCAINATHDVHCWGPHGNSIKSRFSGMYMDTLTAGGGSMCGHNKTGHIICTKNQPNVPSGESFEFTSLAVGSNQTCAITRKNGAVVCWGRHGSYFPMGSTRFEFLVSGGNLTCGLTSDAFNVSCWNSNERNSSAVIQSLPKVLPGVCVSDEASCSCGIYPDSWDLCGGSGVICKKSDTSTVESCQQFSSQVIQHPLAPSQSNWKRFMHKTGTLVFALFGIIVAIVCSNLVVCDVLWWIAREKYQNEPNLPGDPVLVIQNMENVETFTFDLLSTATNRFDRALGEGSFSVVYSGQLPAPDTRLVAVKRFKSNLGGINMDEMFRNEVETLYAGRHANVVRLIGYCTENNERIIVFEQMKKKNLSKHLNPELSEMDSLIYCYWTMRVKILLDVARGLQHLHQNAESRIIHRDIKPSNILIDENWVAKLSDFGNALTGPEPGSESVTGDMLIGTPGYVDPEYAINFMDVYPRYDVYSFGVVILQVLTGSRAANPDGTLLVSTVIPIIEDGRFHEVRDDRLDPPGGGEVVALQRVVETAQQCVRPNGRANMNDVVTALENALALCAQVPVPDLAMAA